MSFLRNVRRLAVSAVAWAFIALVAWPALAQAFTVTASPSDSAVAMGGEFYVRLTTDGSTDLRAYRVVYKYDPTRLQFMGATPGLLATGAGCTIAPFVTADYAEPADSVIFDVAMLGCSVNGAGELARLQFKAIGQGDAAVDCQLIDFRNSLNVHTNPGCSGSVIHIPFIITATASNGTIVPSGSVSVNQGANQAFTYSPSNPCYSLTSVIVDGVSQPGPPASYTFNNVQADHTIAVTFADVTAPVITLVTATSPIQYPAAPVFPAPTVVDACGGTPALTFADVTTPGSCPQSFSVTRTWTATDASGNSSSAPQTVFVEDTEVPVISATGSALALGCNPTAGAIEAALGTATATDNSGSLTPAFVDGAVVVAGLGRSQTRTWSVSDACGNAAVAVSRTATWTEDLVIPVITATGSALALGCNPAAGAIEAALGTATATDNSGSLTPTFADGAVVISGVNRSQTRTWSVSDACGNAAVAVSRTATWTEDTEIPVISATGSALALGCNPTAGAIEAALGTATATDNSGSLTPTFADGAVVVAGLGRSQTRTWSVSDACGNAALAVSRTATWTEDLVIPVITATGSALALGCNPGAGAIEAALGTATASDNSGSLTPSFADGAVVVAGVNRSQTRTWSVSDACGNAAVAVSRTATWTEDLVIPVITATGSSLALGCNPSAGAIEAALGTATASDNSGSLTPTFADGAVVISGVNRSQTRTWSVSDACGNAAVAVSRTATWTEDTEIPVISASGTTLALGCNPGAGAIDAALGSATASDNSGSLTPVASDAAEIVSGCSHSQTRTWNVSDACGNPAVEVSRTVTWTVDVTAPVITLASVVTPVQCPASPVFVTPTVVDGCDATPVLTFADATTPGGSPGTYSVTRTWTATDACDNVSNAPQTIVVEDNTPPVIALVGSASITLECPATYTEQGATASDVCSGPLTPVITGSVDAHVVGVYTLTYTATDAAGNPASVIRTVTVVNNLPPVAATGLTATQLKSGNDADGTTKITISFTAPTDGSPVKVYRKGFGNYPEYDDLPSAGSVPTWPGTGWELTAVTTSGQTDEPANRDFWYYVAVSEDPCGGTTASALTTGTLNYFLGDVANGAVACGGNNAVNTGDITALGAVYGAHLADPGPDTRSCLDVGPTTSGSVDARPLTDNRVDFEDLVIFAINYGTVSQPSASARPAASTGSTTLSLMAGTAPAVGETFEAILGLESGGSVQGISAQLLFDPAVVEPVSVLGGSLLAQQSGLAQVFTPEPGTVDAAVFGPGRTFVGSGELARMTFRVKAAGDPAIHLGDVRARDIGNQPVTLLTRLAVVSQPVPTRMELAPSYPNPFNHATTVVFGMPSTGSVKLAVFDIQGRTVRHLLDGAVPAGWTRMNWDGRSDDGLALAPGAYVIRLSAAGRVITRSVRLVR